MLLALTNTASLDSQNHWNWVRWHTAHSLHQWIQLCFSLLQGRGHILNLCKLLHHLTCLQGPGNWTRGERRVLRVPRRGWALSGKKKRGSQSCLKLCSSPHMTSPFLWEWTSYSEPALLMAVGFILEKENVLRTLSWFALKSSLLY